MNNQQIAETIKTASAKLEQLLAVYAQFGLDKSKKQLSEDVSGLVESTAAELFANVVAPKSDMEADLIVDGENVEIKTTTTQCWRGGTYSKRPGFYIFISWQLVEGTPEWFVATVANLEESDWKASTSKSYYATTMPKAKLFELGATVVMGSLTKTARGHKMGYQAA
jgi:hypothetical protein